MSSAKPWVGGNWKCNGSKDPNSSILNNLNEIQCKNVDIVIFPSFLHVESAMSVSNGNYSIGAQNCSMNDNGAYTGEVSAKMLEEMGVKCVLCGHSERRQYFGESNEIVAKKVEKAMASNMTTVLCIGETLDERNSNVTLQVCSEQIVAVLPKVTDWSKFVIAYEPIWAIGTGVVASSEMAENVHSELRDLLAQHVSPEIAKATPIVYGGSVNASNCDSLISMPNIDGFLVGGASLKPEFSTIIKSVSGYYASGSSK